MAKPAEVVSPCLFLPYKPMKEPSSFIPSTCKMEEKNNMQGIYKNNLNVNMCSMCMIKYNFNKKKIIKCDMNFIKNFIWVCNFVVNN